MVAVVFSAIFEVVWWSVGPGRGSQNEMKALDEGRTTYAAITVAVVVVAAAAAAPPALAMAC